MTLQVNNTNNLSKAHKMRDSLSTSCLHVVLVHVQCFITIHPWRVLCSGKLL